MCRHIIGEWDSSLTHKMGDNRLREDILKGQAHIKYILTGINKVRSSASRLNRPTDGFQLPQLFKRYTGKQARMIFKVAMQPNLDSRGASMSVFHKKFII
jgi:hypothetical protein